MKKSEQPPRHYKMAKTSSKELGPLGLLPGKWEGKRTGWNMIALPFDDAKFKFRILMNQYDEQLVFTTVSDNVENRGLKGALDNSHNPPGSPDDDQFVVALDYQQTIQQGKAEDNPDSDGLAGASGKPIHHEPGLWLYMKNLRATDKDIKCEISSRCLQNFQYEPKRIFHPAMQEIRLGNLKSSIRP